MTTEGTVLMIRVEVASLGIGEQSERRDEGTFFVSSRDVQDVEAVLFGSPQSTISVTDHVPAHEALLEFLIEGALRAWTRSRI